MLIQFRVENHRSLRDEQTLSLVAANIGSDGDDCLIRPEGLGEALLPAVAIYGANASGKTNVLLALDFMRRAVMHSHRDWEPGEGILRDPFALSDRQLALSRYETDILISGVRYRYGFALNARRVEAEWLYAWPRGRRQTWFEREGDKSEFGRNLKGENETIRRLTRPESLFLSSGAQNNHLTLMPLYAWFRRMVCDFPDMRSPEEMWPFSESDYDRGLVYGKDSAYPSMFDIDDMIRILGAADTGIVDLRVERENLVDNQYTLPNRPQLQLRHKTPDLERAWLPVEMESAGTVALLGVAARLLNALRVGSVLCVDELEASLHPRVAGALVRFFCEHQQNPHGAQLIFTTHDTNLLGNLPGFKPLRRDQIWLTEKDNAGATHLYPLTNFHPRKHENLERGYLQGRYGAVPYLGELLDDDAALVQP